MPIKAKLLSKNNGQTLFDFIVGTRIDFKNLSIWLTLDGAKKCREQIFANGHALKKKPNAVGRQYVDSSTIFDQYKDWVVKNVYATPVWGNAHPELLEGLSISLVKPEPKGLLLTNDELSLLDTCLADCTNFPYLSKDYVARVNALREKIKNNR